MKVFAIRIYADCFFLPENDLQKLEVALDKEAIYKTSSIYTMQKIGASKIMSDEGETWINTRHISIVSRRIFEIELPKN